MRWNKYSKVKIFLGLAFVGLLFISFVIFSNPRISTPNSSVTLTPDQLTPTAGVTGTPITLGGEFVCLPHRDQNGPQTLECAFGLKTPEGMYYALRDSDPEYTNISALQTGKKGVVTGIFEPREDTIYPTEGVILIQTIQQ